MKHLPRIPWEKAPDWANYAAYQPTGVLRWFRKEPRKEHLQWSTNILDDRYLDYVALSEDQWGSFFAEEAGMSKTEIELRQAAGNLLKVQAMRDQKLGLMAETELLSAYIRTIDAIIASQSAEQREQDEERKS